MTNTTETGSVISGANIHYEENHSISRAPDVLRLPVYFFLNLMLKKITV